MSSATKSRKPRQRQPRSVNVMVPLNEYGKNGVVKITAGKLAVLYFLDKLESDWGEAFALTKIGGEDTYHVNLTADGPTCDCKGHDRWGHCKHVDALKALRQAGKL